MQPSLVAPNRNRSISVDGFINDSSPTSRDHWQRHAEQNRAYSSSESDDDENDPTSRRRAVAKRRKPDPAPTMKKRSSSALSLESLQNESDVDNHPMSKPTVGNRHPQDGPVSPSAQPARKQQKKALDSSQQVVRRNDSSVLPSSTRINAQMQKHQMSSPYQPQDTVSRKVSQPATRSPARKQKSKHSTESVCEKCGGHITDRAAENPCVCSASPRQSLAPLHDPSATEKEHAVRSTEYPAGLQAESEMNKEKEKEKEDKNETAELVFEQRPETSIINIPPVPDDDGSGWDRFIFFSFRAQRFDLKTHTYLSTFSPFAAVASDMDGLSSTSVCAVCGSGGVLTECIRCPLAFHKDCIDPSRKRQASPWFCNACKAVKGNDLTENWQPKNPPPPLPSPSTGFARLLADVKDGNPIDFVLNPTLFNYYKKECGADWMRCVKCNEIQLSLDGVLTESVRVPFECEYAFWNQQTDAKCSPGHPHKKSSSSVEQVKQYIKQRSRRRNALFFHGFGEENRADFGYPSFDSEDDVIVIDDDVQFVSPSVQDTVAEDNTHEEVSRKIVIQDKEKLPKHITDHLAEIPRGRAETKERHAHGRGRSTSGVPPPSSEAMRKDVDGVTPIPHASAKKYTGLQEGIDEGGSRLQVKRSLPVSSAVLHIDNHPFREETEPQPSSSRPKMVPVQFVDGDKTGEVHLTKAPEQAPHRSGHGAGYGSKQGVDSDGKREDSAEAKSQRDELKAEELQQDMLEFIAGLDLDPDVEDVLTDMALVSHKILMRLFIAYRNSEAKFKRHATRFARRMMTDGSSTGENLVPKGESGASVARPNPSDTNATFWTDGAEQQGESQERRASAARWSGGGALGESDAQANMNKRCQQLSLRHMKEKQDLDATFQAEIASTNASGFPALDRRQNALRQQMEQRHSAEKRELFKLMQSQQN